ncbi:MAG: fumarylacetoacetate hydrolase family protein [Lewinellaceae bacterium]|nr:fumarylacetoacetate hydrolase family protein [Saprospiraceae bacterium]MCB9313930.1 fumarylacetoacetate hydrolase family protein [Lewinellaceae bacterium]
MKILCVGRNYVEHAKELNNPVPQAPMLFMKPATALLNQGKPFYHPEFSQDIHYELEIVLRISGNGRHIEPEFAHKYYDQIALGIDFTARDLQSRLKEKGHPWEIAKAFDHSAVVSPFVDLPVDHQQGIHFELRKNGEVVQSGNTRDMIFSFDDLISYSSRFFKLQTGDYFFTGTPAGVGPVKVGDLLEGYLEGEKLLHCAIR